MTLRMEEAVLTGKYRVCRALSPPNHRKGHMATSSCLWSYARVG